MQYVQNTSNINAPATGVTAGVALAANTARVYFQIQNIGVNPLYVLYGSGTPSAALCHEVLAASATANDGTGGIIRSGTIVYTGAVQVGGTAATYLAYQIAP